MNWEAFAAWWKQPFKVDASVTGWFLFTGLFLILIFLWTRILKEAGHVIADA